MQHVVHKLSAVFFFLFFLQIGQAQFVNFGQSRSSLRWKQIKTTHFQIIYPDFFEKSAQKIANLYTQLYQHPNTLQLKPRKISIVIHADGGISNGNVALVPRKSELYTMPPQEPTDAWLEHLCTHEFRHIVQLDKVNQGLTKKLSFLFGELFPIAVVGAYVPMWFMEGDAVCFESAIGHLGRGRSPEFLNEMKAQIVEKGIYPFSKAVLGSAKDFVPNRYTMGYFMTANSRINYGADIWAKALEYTGKHPFKIVPFRKSISTCMQEKRDSLWNAPAFRSLFSRPDSVKQRNTFANAKRTLYRDNFSELQQIWKKESSQINHHFDTLHTQNKYYTHYYYPTPVGNNSFISYKKGLQETGAFVLVSPQSEKLLTRTGSLDDHKFVYHNHRLVWSEYLPHLRWENGGRMRLSSYDLTTGKYKRYRGKNNQFSPFKTDDGWGFVEINRQNQAFIVLCDSTFQHEKWRLQGEDEEVFIHPVYDNGQIITVVQSPQGVHLESIDIHSRERQKLTQTIYYEMDNPVIGDNCIIFRASYNGNNALYRWKEGKITQIAESRFGTRFPHYQPEERQLYFSFYTADGYKPGKTSYSPHLNHAFEYAGFRLADSMKQQEKWQLSPETDSLYVSQRYNKFTHLLNIHSWGPLCIDLNEMDFDFGAVIYSQNKLSTLSLTAGYLLKSGDEHGKWLLNTTYSGWWPVFSLHLESRKDRFYSTLQAKHIQTDSLKNLYVYNKAQRSEANLTVQFPFNISRKQYNRSFRPYLRYKWEALHNLQLKQAYTLQPVGDQLWAYPTDKKDYEIHQTSKYYQLLEYGFIFNNQTRMTAQEISPRWGQMLSIGYTDVLHQSLDLANQWWYEGEFYFPGIATNHSIGIYNGYQYMFNQTRNYSNQILYPRGTHLDGYEIASLRCSYRFPICYPDLQLGSTLYFKNLEGGIFYDFGSSRNALNTNHYSSYGIELRTNTHFFQLTYPIHLGVRAGYETQNRKLFADLIFSIGLSI